MHLVVNDARSRQYPESALRAAASVWRNRKPVGFAANVNAALARLGGWDRVVVANFDVECDPQAMHRLSAALEPGVALAGPVMSDHAGRPVLSVGRMPSASREFLRGAGLRDEPMLGWQRALLRRSRSWMRRNSASVAPRRLSSTEYLPWTCVALRREAWESVGPLDERFPLYAEDIDWGMRAHAVGWAARLVDVGQVVHSERATRSPETNALYESSHRRLHQKTGSRHLAAAQSAGLLVRRITPVGRLSPLRWDVLAEFKRSRPLSD